MNMSHKHSIVLSALAVVCNGFGSTALAEGDADYRLFLRYAGSPVVEAEWRPTRSKVIYKGPPATHEERYRVIPCVTRMLDGTIIALVEPGGNKPIFIRSTDGAKTWSKTLSGHPGRRGEYHQHNWCAARRPPDGHLGETAATGLQQ